MSWPTFQLALQAVALVPMGVGLWLVLRNRTLVKCGGLAIKVWKGGIATDAQIRRARRESQVGQWLGLAGIAIEIVGNHAQFIADHIRF